MRTMLIKIGILAIVLAMMVGLANASPAQVKITPENAMIPYEPNYVSYSVDVYDVYDAGEERGIIATVASGPSGKEGHLKFKFTNSTGATSGWITPGTSWKWGKPQNTHACIDGDDNICGYENLTMDVMAVSTAPPDVEYGLKVEDFSYGTWDDAFGSTYGTSVPEFATVAIPVATVLGLLFFFNYRKQRKG